MLSVEVSVISRQRVVGPLVRVRAVKSKRVSVMTIDVDSSRGSRCEVAVGRCIIFNKWNNNASVPCLLLNIAKVHCIREFGNDIGVCYRVFVFWLEKDHGSTICDLGFCDDLVHVMCIAIDRC